jgi:hypothetical protein
MLLAAGVFWAWGVRQRPETFPSRQGGGFNMRMGYSYCSVCGLVLVKKISKALGV